MKIISWNLNGLSACIQNNCFEVFDCIKPDIICCQEIRTKQEADVLADYLHFWNASSRGGYSGTLCMTLNIYDDVSNGLGVSLLDEEGRVITL